MRFTAQLRNRTPLTPGFHSLHYTHTCFARNQMLLFLWTERGLNPWHSRIHINSCSCFRLLIFYWFTYNQETVTTICSPKKTHAIVIQCISSVKETYIHYDCLCTLEMTGLSFVLFLLTISLSHYSAAPPPHLTLSICCHGNSPAPPPPPPPTIIHPKGHRCVTVTKE